MSKLKPHNSQEKYSNNSKLMDNNLSAKLKQKAREVEQLALSKFLAIY